MANLAQTLKSGIDYPLANISLAFFFYQIILASICALILEWFYIKFGSSLSNRKRLAQNFLMITLTTTLIINIVKSSLALSLGLVGALSIVRFRTAVKEPEELAYLFLAISLGLGFGAGQILITLIAFFLIILILYLHHLKNIDIGQEGLFVNIKTKRVKNLTIDSLIKKISPYCSRIDIKRVDEGPKEMEISLQVEFLNTKNMNDCLATLRKFLPSSEVTCLDQSGILV